MSNAQAKYGYFVDMSLWPGREVPAKDDDIILHMGACRKDRGCIIDLEQIYKDPDGSYWQIRPGQYFNGASIPRCFWRIITPYYYKIRAAAAFHDVYCTSQSRSQKRTHLMFWRIQRLEGMNPILAFITWLCVRCWCRIRYIGWR